MLDAEGLLRWLKRGRQRVAVAQVLKKPMTTGQLCQAAHALNPRIQVRDVWFLLQQLLERNLAYVLNASRSTGRLHFWTEQGRALAASAFGLALEQSPPPIDWDTYSFVVRAKMRRRVMAALDKLKQRTGQAQTAANLRRHLREEESVGLNPVIRALKELFSAGLVRCIGRTRKQKRRLYELTDAGLAHLRQLQA